MSATAAAQRAKLARMAGQVAAFFGAYPQEQAVAAVADHINQFWSPRMRADLLAALRDGDPAVHPLVAKAAARIRAE